MYDVCIIGGGASGMFASILLARAGVSVAIVEGYDRLGKKLLATGNGKCNLTNTDMSATYYNTREIEGILADFTPDKLREILLDMGLVTKVKCGRVYPYSEQSNSVLNVFRENIAKYKVAVHCDNVVSKINKKDGYFDIVTDKQKLSSKKVCLASGSNANFGRESYDLLASFGHSVSPLRAGLCPFLVDNVPKFGLLNGVRQEGKVSLYIDGKLIAVESGEVQFRKDGVSGIVMFDHASRMARFGSARGEISIDFMPDYTIDQVNKMSKDKICRDYGMLNRVLMEHIVATRNNIKDYRLYVGANKDCKQAQVLVGGIPLSEFDLSTMQSTKCEGLYAIGEALDVDGLCGGYNLHWAFASAYTFAKGGVKYATKTK